MWWYSFVPSWRVSRANVAHVEHKLIQGEDAGKWLPFARTKVAALHARAKAMRVTALTQRWTVEGGDVAIAVRVVGDQRYIHIRRRSCPPFVSGFCDMVLQAGISPVYIVPNPQPPPVTIPIFRRFFPSPATLAADRAFHDEPLLALDTDAADQLPVLRSSMFSGEMRKVVQVLQGMNVFIPYSPTYAVTHGVFKASNGRRWIVEVSNQGIAAWAMQMCHNPIRNASGEVVLDYTPISTPRPLPQDIDAAKAAGAFIDLAPASAVLDFYTKSPYSLASGWAFSESGVEAANVCFEQSSPLRGYLYKIHISENSGAPSNALVSKVSDGAISCEKTTCHMKYPVKAGNVQTYAFDTEAGGLLPVPNDAPVWCFYSCESLQVYRLVFNPAVSVNSQSELVPCVAGCSPTTGPNESGAAFLVAGSETTTAVPHFEGPGVTASIEHSLSFSATYRAHSYADAGVFSTPGVGPHAISSDCSAGLPGTYLKLTQLGEVQYTLSGAEIPRNVMVVPPFDREAVYIGGRLDGRPVTRTSFGAKSYVSPERSINPSDCALGNFDKVADPTTCCTDAPTFSVSANLTEEPFNPGRHTLCDNGTHIQAWFGQPVQDVTAHQYSASAIVGEQGQPNCACPDLTCPTLVVFPATNYSEPGATPTAALSTVLQYIASGGVGTSFTELLGTDFHAGVFEFEHGQVIQSIRDAFDAHKYIISPDVGKLRGDESATTVTDYPIIEAGALMAFVGVP